jgi:isopenicillin-N N-acyltransferase-like protein
MEHVSLSGAPFELGLRHGWQLAQLIQEMVEHSNRYPQQERSRILEHSAAIEAVLVADFPDVVEEMRGIATGAGLPYEDILLLNVGYDARIGAPGRNAHCTAIGLPDTPEGPLVAKTDDVGLEERRFEVLFRMRPATGLAFVHGAFAGTVWDQGGINEAGLALAMTGLPPAGPCQPRGIPSLLFLRQVLHRCRTVAEALAFAEQHPLGSYACSMTMADATSPSITLVENYPALRSVRLSAHEQTAHTNHPLFEETLALPANTQWAEHYGDPRLLPNSQARWTNASRVVTQIPQSTVGLQELLANHAEEGATCQHGQAGLHTSFAMVLVPRRRAMLVAEGYGCSPYVEYTT